MREKKERLSNGSVMAQRFLIAQIIRNKYAMDYWMAALSELKNEPIYRHEVKKAVRQAEQMVAYYEADYARFYDRTGQIDPWEMIQDAACEYWRELRQMMFYHEQATQRLLLKYGFPNVEKLAKLATSKSLLNVVAFIDGLEAEACKEIRPMLTIGGTQTELSRMAEADEHPGRPSVMGHFQRVCERLNLLVISKYGKKDGIFEPDTEIGRSYEIAGTNIQKTLLNYDLMWVLMEGTGRTLEEAKQIIAERKAKEEAKEAKKVKRDKLKKAKAECK